VSDTRISKRGWSPTEGARPWRQNDAAHGRGSSSPKPITSGSSVAAGAIAGASSPAFGPAARGRGVAFDENIDWQTWSTVCQKLP
jgi:hypothetical protein